MAVDFDEAVFSDAFDALGQDEAESEPTPAPEPEPVEDEDEPDVEDEDEPDDDLEAEDVEDEPDEPDVAENEPGRFEVTDDDVIVLPDGSEISVKEGALRQADYTRKTQALADKVRDLEAREDELEGEAQSLQEYFDTRQAQPQAWAAEIALESGNPTAVLASAIQLAAEQGALDPRFVEMLGIEVPDSPTSQILAENDQETRLDRLERERQERDDATANQTETNRLVEQMLQQFDDATQEAGLEFKDGQEASALRAKVAKYATEHELRDLGQAFRAYAYSNPDELPGGKRRKAVNKKTTSAMTRRTTSKGSRPDPKRRPDNLVDAAQAAIEGLSGDMF